MSSAGDTWEPSVSARMSLIDQAESHPKLCPRSVIVKATLLAENSPGEPVIVVYP